MRTILHLIETSAPGGAEKSSAALSASLFSALLRDFPFLSDSSKPILEAPIIQKLLPELSPNIVASVNHLVRRGMHWRDALEAQPLCDTSTGDAVARIVDGARGNWIWLMEVPRWDVALDLSGGLGTMTSVLRQHFTRVHYVATSIDECEFVEKRCSQDRLDRVSVVRAAVNSLPYKPDAFDCISVDGPIDPIRQPLTILRACRPLLRSGGCLQFATGAAARRGLGASSGRMAYGFGVIRVTSALRRAGFRAIISYYVAPSVTEPRNMIPADRRSAYAYETMTKSRVGALLAKSPLRYLLYSAQVHLAYV